MIGITKKSCLLARVICILILICFIIIFNIKTINAQSQLKILDVKKIQTVLANDTCIIAIPLATKDLLINIFSLPEEKKIVADISPLRISNPRFIRKLDDNDILQIRGGQYNPTTARIVLDLKDNCAYKYSIEKNILKIFLDRLQKTTIDKSALHTTAENTKITDKTNSTETKTELVKSQTAQQTDKIEKKTTDNSIKKETKPVETPKSTTISTPTQVTQKIETPIPAIAAADNNKNQKLENQTQKSEQLQQSKSVNQEASISQPTKEPVSVETNNLPEKQDKKIEKLESGDQTINTINTEKEPKKSNGSVNIPVAQNSISNNITKKNNNAQPLKDETEISKKTEIENKQSANADKNIETKNEIAATETENENNNLPSDPLISLDLKDAELSSVLRLLSQSSGLNIIAGQNVVGKVTISLKNVPLSKILDSILTINGYSYIVDNNIIKVVPTQSFGKLPEPYTTIIIQLKNAPVEEILQPIKSMLSANGRVEILASSNSLILTDISDFAQRAQTIINQLDTKEMWEQRKDEFSQKNYTKIFMLKYAKPDELKETLEKTLTPPTNIPIYKNSFFRVITDNRINAIIVHTNIANYLKLAKEMIAELDKAVKQILIEAKFIEISLDKGNNLGIDWSNFGNVNVQTSSDVLTYDIKNWHPTYGTISVKQFNLILKNLDSNANMNLLSTPRITTLDNKKAVIKISDNIITDVQTTESQSGNITQTPIRSEVGIILEVLPHINNDTFITLELTPQVNEAQRSAISTGVNIIKREAKTTVIAKNGETIALGGLIKNYTSSTNSGVPILSKIPILNTIFGHNSKNIQKKELVIFITPTIIDTTSQLSDKEREYLNRANEQTDDLHIDLIEQ